MYLESEMAEAFRQELTCAVCLDLFTEPVLLSCGHCFCKKCITDFWDTENRASSCPECRAPCLDRQQTPSRLLGNLAQKAWEIQGGVNINALQKAAEVSERRQAEGGKEDGQSKLLCEAHGGSLELFCTTDKTLICFYCIDSLAHAGHNFSSLENGAQVYKEKLDKALRFLKSRIMGLEQHKGQQKEKIHFLKDSATSLRANIRARFSELHQVLHQKQTAVLAELEKDEKVAQKEMVDRLEQIRERLHVAKEMMTEGKNHKELNNPGTFILGIQQFLAKLTAENKFQSEGYKDDLPVLCREFSLGKFKGPTQHVVGRPLCLTIAQELEPIQLDPNTAHPVFTIDDKGMHLMVPAEHQEYWNNPQRCQGYQTVCGKDGFTSGKHYWETETEDRAAWFIGVTTESIAKKTQVGPECWKDNIWALQLARLEDISPGDMASCWRFGVYLDYEEGQVSFYNVNNGSHLGTCRAEFKEKIYPFFCHFACASGKDVSLTICQKWNPGAPVS